MTPLLCDVTIQTSFLDSSRRILCNNFQLWQAWMISSFLVTFLILPVVHYHLQKQSGLLFPTRKRAKQIPRVGSMPLSDFLSLGGPWVRVTLPPPAHARQGHRRWVCPWSHIQTFWTGWPAGLQCRHSWSPEGHSKWCPSQVFPSSASSVHCTVKCCPVSLATHVRLIWRQHWVCHIEWNIHIVNLSAFTLQLAYPESIGLSTVSIFFRC